MITDQDMERLEELAKKVRETRNAFIDAPESEDACNAYDAARASYAREVTPYEILSLIERVKEAEARASHAETQLMQQVEDIRFATEILRKANEEKEATNGTQHR